MRSYIFTEREREILHAWLEKKEKLEGFNRLAFNTRKDIVTLIEDMKLVFSVIAVNFPEVESAATMCDDVKQVVEEWKKQA
jgi:hypothetical protein